MYTFSKCKVKHLLLSVGTLPPIRLDRGPGTARFVTATQKSPHSDIHCRSLQK